ncbi:tetratricopeptide (TPR) repeat protein [Nocardiopsis arvandica]|uniref:Tetratricopeptide (TPR) repeat protein n=1 Tax=Nocardiopsis sinuspersici TaxID=501010 RepID=A0A7Y9XAF7_9ACTN|nr:tetratricopeptide repeat protein [Nocardiopsis sinuspersici]NYH51372.1 tetratricopeptide (TPR) repeat protein [Nocardiopsis sinuspersici]
MLDTADRITRLTSPHGSGSGYVIAPRLVLTSAHAVPEVGGQVWVRTATDHQPYGGEVTWRGTPHGHDDAALVQITDPGWVERAVSTRWGRLVTTTPGTPCEVWGSPDLVQRPGRAPETAQLVGTVAPGTHFVNHRHMMDLSAHPPRWYPHEIEQQQKERVRRSLWAGLSGAALRCSDGELLVGVVAADLEHRDHAALEVVPAYVLHHDPAFRAVLAEHGVPLALEPVELTHLAHTPRTHQPPSPAALLEANRQVVDFHGRDQEMNTLTQWCQSDEALSAMVVHGPGGQGKTRLAHELTTQLTHPDTHGRRWATVWLKESATSEELDQVKTATVPLLLVLDYAETRTAQLIRLVQLCDRPPGSTPVRLLLVVRTVGEWWEQVNTATGHLLADITQQLPLPPLKHRIIERAEEYRTALHHLAHALPLARTPHPAEWTQAAADLPDPNLSGPEWDTVLSVHMRALADLLDATQPATSITVDSAVEGRVLTHEYRYWNQTATAHGLGEADLTQPLRDVLALAFALAPSSIEKADSLLEDAAVLQGQTTARKHQIRRWISGLYPAGGAGMWGQLQPDRLLEYFLGQRLQNNPALFDPHLNNIATADTERLVTLYAHAATHPALPYVGGHLTELCTRHIRTLGPAVVEVATQAESPGPLIQALSNTTADPDISLKVLAQLSDALPRFSQRLAVWAEHLTTRLVETRRERAERNPAYLPVLAASLNNQAIRLGAVGRNEEALNSSTQAVKHYHTLVEQDPDTHLPNLAASLNNQATRLAALGRNEEALNSSTQAVKHYHTLVEQDPDTHLPNLAASLNNQATRLAALGRNEEALNPSTQAVHIREALANQRPDAHLPDLAASLNNQGNCLGALGELEEALEAITEAVGLRRTLAQQRPDAHLPNLATSLNNQAKCLGALGRTEEALEAITEAVDIRSALAEKRPAVHQESLERSLRLLEALRKPEADQR